MMDSCPGWVSEVFSRIKSRKHSTYHLDRIRKTHFSAHLPVLPLKILLWPRRSGISRVF